jgi:acetoacetyl-CoA synthetase
MSEPTAPAPLYVPSDDEVADTAMAAFAAAVATDWDVEVDDSRALWAWSVERPLEFWLSLRDFCAERCGLRASAWGDRVLAPDDAPDRVTGVRWFPDARLNFAENLLHGPEGSFRDDPRDALVSWVEDAERRRLSRGQLYDAVARLAATWRGAGVGPGDVVAAWLPNVPEAVVSMLAAAAIGATFTSCSPDFGVQAVLDRFGQVAPRVLVVTTAYRWKGQLIDIRDKVAALVDALPDLVRTVVVVPPGAPPPSPRLRRELRWDEALDAGGPGAADALRFEQLPFDHPLYILYSSGTTGKPKCIVHGAGGTLLKHLSELVLHTDVRDGDRVFYYTTCGWMMWNWLVSALAVGATLLLFDGSPFHPRPEVLFDFADAEGMSLFGTSARYLDALSRSGAAPARSHGLSQLRRMCSTGSPLSAEGFRWVHANVKAAMPLCSISGGTDIVGCFVLGDPTAPVWAGEIQGPALGVAVDVVDEDGQPLPPGARGELVCRQPFPSMPVAFFNDPGGARYRAAYFERFPGLWCHGDWCETTERGGWIIHGRSDATLNPGGVRIGTAELYRQLEGLPEVEDAVVIGQDWQGDVRVVLFVVLAEGRALDTALQERIRARIRDGASPRHVPARVIQVPEVPRTRSGKISELAVRRVVHGQDVPNIEALANPGCLAAYRGRPELSA